MFDVLSSVSIQVVGACRKLWFASQITTVSARFLEAHTTNFDRSIASDAMSFDRSMASSVQLGPLSCVYWFIGFQATYNYMNL